MDFPPSSLRFDSASRDWHCSKMFAECCIATRTTCIGIEEELKSLGYAVEESLLNAVDFGAPQRRERLFVVAHKGAPFVPYKCERRFTAGEALGTMARSVPPNARFLTPSMDDYVARYEAKSMCIRPRDLHLDAPSRTVTCEILPVPQRYLLRGPASRRTAPSPHRSGRRAIAELPRLVSLQWGRDKQFKQVANAVPPLLAKAVAKAVWTTLFSGVELSPTEIAEFNARGQTKLFA